MKEILYCLDSDKAEIARGGILVRKTLLSAVSTLAFLCLHYSLIYVSCHYLLAD